MTEKTRDKVQERFGVAFALRVADPDLCQDGADLEIHPDSSREGRFLIRSKTGESAAAILDSNGIWLAALARSGMIRLNGRVRNLQADTVFLDGEGRLTRLGTSAITSRKLPMNPQEVLHDMVLAAYKKAVRYTDRIMLSAVYENLTAMVRNKPVLPETHLLLALIKSRLDALSNGGNGSFAKQIGEHLKKIEIGQPVHSHSLSLFPLLGSWEEKSRYVLLEEGLAAGTVAVTETSEAGQVPYLLLRNDGDLPVLLPEGAILKGEKQNRVINTTILVAAKSVFTVPVSCVEQGRWHRSRHGFQADSHAPSSLRSKKMRAVQESRAFRGTAESNQSEVWREVAFAMDSLNVRSNTGSMSDAYERRRVDLDVLRRNLTPPPQALGVVMCRNNRIVGMDLFDSSQTFSKVWPRLADGYLIEALNDAPCDQAVNASSVESFLSDIPQFSRRADPTLGIGTEFNIQGNQMVGTGVLYEEAVCHLCAFAGSASGL